MLYGGYGCGKTVWARSLGPHIYFGSQWSGEEALKGWETAEYAIFDDWAGGLEKFPRYKDWLGCQWDVSVKKLFQDPVVMSWGRPCIYLVNRDPRIMAKAEDGIDWAWLEDACIFVECVGQLASFPENSTSHANTVSQ